MRWMLALGAVVVVAIAGIALAAAAGDDEQEPRGSDLTAIRCPLAPTGETVGGVPQYEPAEGAFDTAELIGMTLDEARARAAEDDCEVVVSLADGRGRPVPIDVDPKRIYVYTENGVVTEIESVGGGL